MTRLPSVDLAIIARETERACLFAPYMISTVEGQFLKILAQIKDAKRVFGVGPLPILGARICGGGWGGRERGYN